MLNGTDTVGHTFKRAFYRVDGVTMYAFWVIWIAILIWTVFDVEAPKIKVFATLMIGLMGPFLYLMFGLMRFPGLVTAIAIAVINIRFLSAYF
jgi:hypothetical protein